MSAAGNGSYADRTLANVLLQKESVENAMTKLKKDFYRDEIPKPSFFPGVFTLCKDLASKELVWFNMRMSKPASSSGEPLKNWSCAMLCSSRLNVPEGFRYGVRIQFFFSADLNKKEYSIKVLAKDNEGADDATIKNDDKDFFDKVAMPYLQQLRLQTASIENSRFVDLMTSALTDLSVGKVTIRGDADRIAKGVAIVVKDAKNKTMTKTIA